MKSPKEIALSYVDVAKTKTSQPWWKTLLLGIMAGMFISLGGMIAISASCHKTGVESAIIKGLVFPMGLILVVLCGSELFTGNCLLFGPVMSKDIKVGGMFKNLAFTYLGNIIGSVAVALLVVYSGSLNQSAVDMTVSIANAKSAMNFGEVVIRGILCNILVCIAVWASMAGKTPASKILGLYLPIFAFVVLGYEHCVANMYYFSAGLFASAKYGVESTMTATGIIFNNMVPATIGNMIGGMGFVALPYWAIFLKNK